MFMHQSRSPPTIRVVQLAILLKKATFLGAVGAKLKCCAMSILHKDNFNSFSEPGTEYKTSKLKNTLRDEVSPWSNTGSVVVYHETFCFIYHTVNVKNGLFFSCSKLNMASLAWGAICFWLFWLRLDSRR